MVIDEKERFRQRIQFSIQALIHDDYKILSNSEFVEYLPQFFLDHLEQDDKDVVLQVLSKLEKAATNDNKDFRELSIVALSKLLEELSYEKAPHLVQIIVRIITDWIRFETEYPPVYDAVCSQLVMWGKTMLGQNCYEDLEYLFLSFHHIASGQLQKSEQIVNCISATQKRFASENILDVLLKESLSVDDATNSVARNLLTNMGPVALDYLLDQLLISESKEDRFKLMKMIMSGGKTISKLLLARLEKHAPWYFIRNILLMMTMLDDSSMFPGIKGFLSHEDIRVQQQAIQYIDKEDKDIKKQYLLEALFLVCDQLKVKSIMSLADIGGEEVVEVFMDLLEKRSDFSKEYKDELLMSLCIALEESTQVRAVTLLKQIIEERRMQNGQDDKVIAMAQSSLNKIEPGIRRISQKNGATTSENGNNIETKITFKKDDGRKDFEKQVLRHLQKGEISAAEELLYEKAIIAIHNEDYSSALYYRDKIVDIGSGELDKIIEISNLIEERRSLTATEPEHDIWNELKEKVNKKEFELFYKSLLLQEYDNDEIIVRQGNFDPGLYFIKSGVVNLTCLCAGYETFLKRMRKGDVVGVTSFFDASVWSTTLVAHRDVACYYLDQNHFAEVTKVYPAFEKKLHTYCIQKDQVPELLKMSGEERRQSPRFQIKNIIKITLLDRFGIIGRSVFRAEIIGISSGGLTCITRVDKKQNARLLLGRMITSRIGTGVGKNVKCKGMIIGVKEDKSKEMHYSIHVKFDTPLSQSDVSAIVSHNTDK